MRFSRRINGQPEQTLKVTDTEGRLCAMNWIENVQAWRQLPAEEKLLRRWRAIPLDVAQSMAFEKEPVEVSHLQEILVQIGPPALLKPRGAFSPTPSQLRFGFGDAD